MENIELSKADQRKIKKLEEALHALKEGQETCFSITKLTSIKTLCKSPDTAVQFALYLSKLTSKKVDSSSCPKYTDPKEWEKYKKIIKRSLKLMHEFIKEPEEKNISSLRELLEKVQAVQNKTRSGPYGSVIRTIHSTDVLVIEDSIRCMLYTDDAPYWAYKLARDYTEKYNSSHGTGLIPESILMLEDIILFWKKTDMQE